MRPFYELIAPGTLPVLLTEMKECLKMSSDRDDDFITVILQAATETVEKALHGREIRARTYGLFLNQFDARMCLAKDPVASVTTVEYLVDDVFTTVASSVYRLVQSQQFSEVVLKPDQVWPTDIDDLDHAVKITFVTAPHDCVEMARAAIKRFVTYMYENRGDCDPDNTATPFQESGAQGMIALLAIKLV